MNELGIDKDVLSGLFSKLILMKKGIECSAKKIKALHSSVVSLLKDVERNVNNIDHGKYGDFKRAYYNQLDLVTSFKKYLENVDASFERCIAHMISRIRDNLRVKLDMLERVGTVVKAIQIISDTMWLLEFTVMKSVDFEMTGDKVRRDMKTMLANSGEMACSKNLAPMLYFIESHSKLYNFFKLERNKRTLVGDVFPSSGDEELKRLMLVEIKETERVDVSRFNSDTGMMTVLSFLSEIREKYFEWCKG